MVQVQRTVVGAAMALALVICGVTTVSVMAAGGPNCLTAPCPPPENRAGAEVDQVSLAGGPNCRVPCPPPPAHSGPDADVALSAGDYSQGFMLAPSGPNCISRPCPPPENNAETDEQFALLEGDARPMLAAGGPVCLTAPCPPPKGS
jgi:hypothetical protein